MCEPIRQFVCASLSASRRQLGGTMERLKTTGLLGKVCRRAIGAAAAFLLTCGIAHATLIFSGTISVSAGDPTQLGRLSRNGVAQDWAGSEPFPGIINPGTTYHYVTLDLD